MMKRSKRRLSPVYLNVYSHSGCISSECIYRMGTVVVFILLSWYQNGIWALFHYLLGALLSKTNLTRHASRPGGVVTPTSPGGSPGTWCLLTCVPSPLACGEAARAGMRSTRESGKRCDTDLIDETPCYIIPMRRRTAAFMPAEEGRQSLLMRPS